MPQEGFMRMLIFGAAGMVGQGVLREYLAHEVAVVLNVRVQDDPTGIPVFG